MNYSTNLDNSNSDNSNSSLTTWTVYRFPSLFELLEFYCTNRVNFHGVRFFFSKCFLFLFLLFFFFFTDRWKTREICQKRIRRNTAVFMTSYIILIKLSEVQFGRNITWPRDLKIGRARSARSITNKYDCKQKLRVSRSSVTTLWQPSWNRKFSQHQYFIDYFTYFFVCKTEVMPFKACL